MSKFLDENGLLYLWSKIKTLLDSKTGTVNWTDVQNKPDLALKSDLARVYRYRGSVAGIAALPAEGSAVGDVWDVADTGMNYAWDGEKWDPLGAAFAIEAISNAEIDQIMAG